MALTKATARFLQVQKLCTHANYLNTIM